MEIPNRICVFVSFFTLSGEGRRMRRPSGGGIKGVNDELLFDLDGDS